MIDSRFAVARPDSDSPPLARRSRRLPLRAGIAALASTLVAAMGMAVPAHAATDHVVIGASGDAAALESKAGTTLARHIYGTLSGPARVAALVNIETTVNWSQVASGSQDANIKRWAAALKGKNIMVSFSHEPMAKQNSHFGDAASFIAAWKHVVSVFDAQGSTSVQWVWNVTSQAFRVSSSDASYGAKWYPGDAYVDYVAGEAYNKAGCGQPNTSFADKISQIFAFAGQHGKKFVTAEFASNQFDGRAAWIDAAHAYINAHRSQFAGAFYYNPVTSDSCHWHLTTSAEFAAIRSLATAPGFGV